MAQGGSAEERLAHLAVEAVGSALDVACPKLAGDDGEHLEHWLLGLAMHLYWKLSGRSIDDPGMSIFYGRLCELAVEAHRARFGEFGEGPFGGDGAEEFQDDITEFYDQACDVVAEAGARGLMALHNILAKHDVLAGWQPSDQTIGTLASMAVFERALKDIPAPASR